MKTLNLGIQTWIIAGALALAPGQLFAKEPSPALDLARQLNKAFVELAEDVSPSVVVILVSQKDPNPISDDGNGAPWNVLPPELRRYFHGNPGNGRQRQTRSRETHPITGQGSGIVINKDGFILTNNHVVEGADKIWVVFKDHEQIEATVRGTDPQSEVAVIKVDPKSHELVPAKLGDSAKTKVGEFAIAIGAPFQLDYTVTFGHVSAKGRSMLDAHVMMDQNFIQTDASINPGNSGGPLINIEGEVIGINTMIRGMNTGIGFAVPINTAKQVSERLIADGKFSRTWLGIGIDTLGENSNLRDLIKGVKQGVVVVAIEPEGPADKSDLQPADVITSVDGVNVVTAEDLKAQIRAKKAGQNVTLDVVRDGTRMKIAVKPGEMPQDTLAVNHDVHAPAATSANDLGLKVKPVTRALAEQYGIEATEGVIVIAVEDGSIAEERNIRPGDVITKIDNHPVTGIKDFREAVKNIDLKKGVRLNLLGERGRRFEVLKDTGR